MSIFLAGAILVFLWMIRGLRSSRHPLRQRKQQTRESLPEEKDLQNRFEPGGSLSHFIEKKKN